MKLIKYLLVLTIVFSSCKGKEATQEELASSDSENPAEETVQEKLSAVCITDRISIREEPHKNGKWISRLSLGEKLTYLGKSHIDTTDKNKYEYHFVELSDGKKVWAYAYGLLINAKAGAVTKKTAIYSRPDLVTKTTKEFQVLDFVAVIGEKGDWVEVVGAGKKKSGWIPSKKITTKSEDVSVATLAYKSIFDSKTGTILVEKIADFIEELPYDNTQFEKYLQGILDDSVEEAIEESVETYEEEVEAELEEVEEEM